jgi:hypothetical protein
MPATFPRNEGKTAFVKEMLRKNPQANPSAVNDAWKAAGKKGTISSSLVQKSRAALGLTGAPGARPGRKAAPKKAPAAQPTKAPTLTGLRGNSLALEAEIDRLLFKVIDEGGMEDVEDALRSARRRLIVATQ